MENLFAIGEVIMSEQVSILHSSQSTRIEKIVSFGAESPSEGFYDQDEEEWVTVLEGYGVLSYEDGTSITLHKGDSFFIPSHQKHRVSETSNPCIWLCVFFAEQS